MAESPVVLGSGLVVIRNALSEEKQCWLAKYAKAAGEPLRISHIYVYMPVITEGLP